MHENFNIYGVLNTKIFEKSYFSLKRRYEDFSVFFCRENAKKMVILVHVTPGQKPSCDLLAKAETRNE